MMAKELMNLYNDVSYSYESILSGLNLERDSSMCTAAKLCQLACNSSKGDDLIPFEYAQALCKFDTKYFAEYKK